MRKPMKASETFQRDERSSIIESSRKLIVQLEEEVNPLKNIHSNFRGSVGQILSQGSPENLEQFNLSLFQINLYQFFKRGNFCRGVPRPCYNLHFKKNE